MRHAKPLWDVALSCGLAAAALIACGARSPLDDGAALTLTAQVEGGASADDSSAVGSKSEGTDSPADADASGSYDGGCAASLASCLKSSSCAKILVCAITQCANIDGGSQISCALQCSGNNVQQLTQLVPIFQCLMGGGSAGGGVLGGLLGGGGLPGGGSAGGGLLGGGGLPGGGPAGGGLLGGLLGGGGLPGGGSTGGGLIGGGGTGGGGRGVGGGGAGRGPGGGPLGGGGTGQGNGGSSGG